VFLVDHPSAYRMAGTRRGTAASKSTNLGTTSGPHHATTADGATLREAVDTFISCPRCANPNTRRAYAAALDNLLAGLSPDRLLANLASDELAAVFATKWADAAPATWNRNRAAVSSWLA
jgi:hypothetical protein